MIVIADNSIPNDYDVNLQRIKKADTGNNPELEYQLRVVKNKLASLGIPSEEFEM